MVTRSPPLVHPEIVRLVSQTAAVGISCVIITNGWFLQRYVSLLAGGVARHRSRQSYVAVFGAALLTTTGWGSVTVAQTANSNAGLQGGQNGMFDAILATPNYKTPVLPDSALATTPGLEQAVPTPQFTLNVLATALYNSNAQFLSSGGSKTLEGSPLVRLGWASQLFDTPIRVSGTASLETERFVNAPGAAIDYIRTSARAQYINPKTTRIIRRFCPMCCGSISIPLLRTILPPGRI